MDSNSTCFDATKVRFGRRIILFAALVGFGQANTNVHAGTGTQTQPLPMSIDTVTAERSAASSARANLKARIVEFVIQEIGGRHPGARVSGDVELSNAIRPPCPTPTISKVGKAGAARMSLMLRCEDSRWTAYVSAGSAISLPVLVLTRPIARGSRIQAADVELQLRPMHELRPGYLFEPSTAVGQESRRALAAGSVLYQRGLQPPNLVVRGERVRIEAAMGSSMIATIGEAKANGVAGAQILVKNLQSGRTVRAWVLGRGKVSTRPPTQ